MSSSLGTNGLMKGPVCIPHGATVPSSDREVKLLQEQEARKRKKNANPPGLGKPLHVGVIISKSNLYL